MFENLTKKFTNVFDKLKGKGALSEKDINESFVEIRKALLDADVALPVVDVFLKNTKEKALGTEVIRSVTPGQMIVKVVYDEIVNLLSNDNDSGLNIDHSPPAVILLVGLQGSGKTTTAAKLAKWIKTKKNKKVLLASLDTYRPAAKEQLRLLGEEAEVLVLPSIENDTPNTIAKRAKASAKIQGIDVLILDTAGRQTIDTSLMAELKEINQISNPSEIILVADAMTGQDAVNTAKSFKETIDISGLILSRADGDARGGAALSMQHVTNCPIKFLGVGEKQSDLELFNAERFANRVLGMGDVVGLVEKAAEVIEKEESEELMKRMTSGQFLITDLLKQLRQVKKMGGMGSIMGMLPGMGKMQKQLSAANVDDKMISHQEAIILSMTDKEKKQINILNASRRKRIASGSGTSVQEVNRLVKQYMEMAKMMKKIGRQGGGGLLKNLFGGGMSSSIPQTNPEELLNSAQNPLNFNTKSRLPLNIPFRKK